MLLTLNQVISQITTLGAAHLQIQSTGVGDFAEWQALERAYPLLWVFHETTSIGDRELVYSIRLVCADRVITGEEGDDTAGMEQEVLSDTLLILLDFLAYFQQQHAQSYKVITSASIDPFTERFNDRVAGNSVLIQIRQPFTWDACQIPQTGATIPPSVDGLTLYDFCDPSVIARLTPSQVACLEAEYGITCVDATVTQNGNAFFTVPAGATYPLVTKLDGANSLGSFNAGTKTLSFTSNPSNLQINGAQSEIIPGNSTFNLLAKLDGVAGGVYNAGLDTLNFTTTPAILQRNAIQIKTLANASTFNLKTKLDGTVNNGTWDGVDTLDFTSAACSPVTFQINAVNKESLSSGSTFNLITKLDGAVNSGSYDAPTDTLSFTSVPIPSLSLAISDTTPNVGDVITITATVANFTPISYIFYWYDGSAFGLLVEQAGSVYNWTVNKTGTYDVFVVAVNATDAVADYLEITATSVYLLDQIASTPNLAFSVRRLRAAYTGNAALVRRSSDNTTLAIGFIGENMDTTALTTFVGVGNGFTATLYNQMGSNNASQATALNQPSLVVAGSVVLLNSRPTIDFDSLTDLLTFTPVGVSHCLAVAKANTTAAATGQYIAGGTDQGFGIAGAAVSGIYIYNSGAILQTSIKNTTAHQISYRCGSGVSRIRVDGTTAVTGSIAALTINTLGNRQDIAFNADSRISEFITFASNIPDAQELVIEANQKVYYGTP